MKLKSYSAKMSRLLSVALFDCLLIWLIVKAHLTLLSVLRSTLG